MTFLWDLPEILRSSLTMIWKLIAIPFRVIACTSDTLFSENLSRKNCNYNLFPSEDTVTNPAVLLVLNAVRIFLSLPTGTVSLARVADYIPNFVAIFYKFISFCRLGSIFKQIIWKQIKTINNLSILSFSLLSIWLPTKKKKVMKLILVANVFKWVDTRPKDRL